MTDRRDVLKVLTKELTKERTLIYQLEDGTIVHFQYEGKQRLYVNRPGRTIDAQLPTSRLSFCGVNGNSIYLKSATQIYECSFTLQRGFTVYFLRYASKGESVSWFGNCTREVNEKTYFFPVWNEADKFSVKKEDSGDIKKGHRLIHRNKLIVFTQNETELTAEMVRDNIVCVKTSANLGSTRAPSSSSPFIYLSYGDEFIHILNADTMQFVNRLRIAGIYNILQIIGVYNGIITVITQERSREYLVTAQIPEVKTNSTQVTAVCDKIEKMTTKKKEQPIQQKSISSISSQIDSDSIRDQCCCIVCTETYDSKKCIPQVLDCGHTFCAVCIKTIVQPASVLNKTNKCPSCSKIIVPEGKVLPVNYALLSIAEQSKNKKFDSKISCKECGLAFSSTSVRKCVKEDCEMVWENIDLTTKLLWGRTVEFQYNQLICVTCALDGGHGGHVVKYDGKMEKIRSELRSEVADICNKIEIKKTIVGAKSDQVMELVSTLKQNLLEAKIPQQVIDQIDSLASEQDVNEYREIIKELATPLTTECETLADALDSFIETTKGLRISDNKEE